MKMSLSFARIPLGGVIFFFTSTCSDFISFSEWQKTKRENSNNFSPNLKLNLTISRSNSYVYVVIGLPPPPRLPRIRFSLWYRRHHLQQVQTHDKHRGMRKHAAGKEIIRKIWSSLKSTNFYKEKGDLTLFVARSIHQTWQRLVNTNFLSSDLLFLPIITQCSVERLTG
jgi:hypothetical protein